MPETIAPIKITDVPQDQDAHYSLWKVQGTVHTQNDEGIETKEVIFRVVCRNPGQALQAFFRYLSTFPIACHYGYPFRVDITSIEWVAEVNASEKI